MAANDTSAGYLPWTEVEVIFLGMYCTIATVLGLIGNSIVIYSSIRYNAVELDRISLIFTQHLALADILYILIEVFPASTTFMAGKYVLGNGYCFLSAQLPFIPGTVNSLIVLSITGYRLRMITFPFLNVSKNTVFVLLAVIWVVGLTGTVISLSYRSSSLFDPVSVSCSSDIYTVGGTATLLLDVVVGVFIFIPLIAVTIMNFILVVVAIKSANRHNEYPNFWGLLTVCCISGLYIISWVPLIIYMVVETSEFPAPPSLRLMGFYCIFLNTFIGPILYTLTNKRFGRHVKGLLCSILFCHRKDNVPARFQLSSLQQSQL